jgi:hypothetical protein
MAKKGGGILGDLGEMFTSLFVGSYTRLVPLFFIIIIILIFAHVNFPDKLVNWW